MYTRHVLLCQLVNILYLICLLLCWQAPLGVCSAKRRHQSPEWTILSHVNCFIQGEVIGFQVLLDSLHGCPDGLLHCVEGKAGCYGLLGICFVLHSCNVAEQAHKKRPQLLVLKGTSGQPLQNYFVNWLEHCLSFIDPHKTIVDQNLLENSLLCERR